MLAPLDAGSGLCPSGGRMSHSRELFFTRNYPELKAQSTVHFPSKNVQPLWTLLGNRSVWLFDLLMLIR